MMRCVKVLCVALLLSAATVAIPRADGDAAPSIDALTRTSDLVATGHVTDLRTARDPANNWIYTYVTIDLTEVLSGSVDSQFVVLKQLGGTIGSETMVVFDQARFSFGEDVLFFAEARPRDGSLYTSELWEGKWTIERDARTNARIATRERPEVTDRGIFRQELERRDLSSLRQAILDANGSGGGHLLRPVNVDPDRGLRLQQDGLRFRPEFAFFNSPGRWNEYDTGQAINVTIQSTGQPALAGGGWGEWATAMGLWSAATPLRFRSTAGAGGCSQGSHTAGSIVVSYMDPCGEIGDATGTFAIAGYFCVNNGGLTIGGTFFCRNTGAFIVNNNNGITSNLYAMAPFCFQSVQTHMLGHALGLGHSLDPGAIMFATISSACHNGAIGLNADDVAGIRFVYPSAGGPPGGPPANPPPGPPSGLSATVAGAIVTLSWTAPAGGAATGYQVEAGSGPGMLNLANFNTGNTGTSFSANAVPAGTYYVRVKSVNPAGMSAASNEIVVVVR
jgi:hypothetical protein